MKHIYILFVFSLGLSKLVGQCDGTPNDLGSATIASLPQTPTTAQLRVTANQIITNTSGLFGSLIISGPSATPDVAVTLDGASSTGLTFNFVYDDMAGTKYWFFNSAQVINPSTLFPNGTPVTIGTITTPSPLSSFNIVLTDLAPPVDNGGVWSYNRTAIQVCNANGFEDNLITQAPNAPLPIKLTSFFANKDGERAVRLDWISKQEVNSDHFGIERSVNDINSFEKIGEVAAAGNSSSEIKYQFFDKNLPFSRDAHNTFYYRLEQVDVDGFTEYSEIRSVSFTDDLSVTVSTYPNPTASSLFVEMTSADAKGEATLQMMDMSGKLVAKRTISSNGVTEINVSDMTNGMYDVRVDFNGKVFNQKVIKTN